MGNREIWERIHQLHAGVTAHCGLSHDSLQGAAPERPHVERSSMLSAISRSAPCNLTPAKLLGIWVLSVESQSSHEHGLLLGSPSALRSTAVRSPLGVEIGSKERQKQELNLVQCTQLLQTGQSIWHLSSTEETSFYLQDYNGMGNGTTMALLVYFVQPRNTDIYSFPSLMFSRALQSASG